MNESIGEKGVSGAAQDAGRAEPPTRRGTDSWIVPMASETAKSVHTGEIRRNVSAIGPIKQPCRQPVMLRLRQSELRVDGDHLRAVRLGKGSASHVVHRMRYEM